MVGARDHLNGVELNEPKLVNKQAEIELARRGLRETLSVEKKAPRVAIGNFGAAVTTSIQSRFKEGCEPSF